MKTNRMAWALLLVLTICITSPAQKSEEDLERFQEIKSKAQRGDPDAQRELGLRYYNGDGVPKDYEEATKWFGMAAEQRRTGVAQLTPQQDEADRKLFAETKAKAEKGDPEDQFALADSYFLGRGVSQDPAEAANWYHKAAVQGHTHAMVSFGLCYYNGSGTSRDYSQAVKWFQKAAEQGNPCGQAMVGECYKDGTGLPRNDIQAYKWLSLAASYEWRNLKLSRSYEDLNHYDVIGVDG